MAVTYDGYLDGIEREDGKIYGFNASAISGITASTVSSYANTVPYEYTATDGKIHKGLEFTNNGYKGYVELGSTGNMSLEARGTAGEDGNANIEATKQIKFKPTTKIQLDSSRRIMLGSDNEVNVEAYFNDFGDTLYDGKKGADEEWASLKVSSRAMDLRCIQHGGLALQPAGADSDNHVNKIKFEHSLKVSIEHFGEYTMADGGIRTVYDFPENEWVCLGQTIEGQAFQLFTKKILSKAYALSEGVPVGEIKKSDDAYGSEMHWNDDMVSLSNGNYGLNMSDSSASTLVGEWAIGYATTNDATDINPAAIADTYCDMLGKYVYVKRLEVTSETLKEIPDIYVKAEMSGETATTKFVVSTTGVKISVAATGTSTEEEYSASVAKDGNSYPINEDGEFTIEKITYIISGDTVYPKDQEDETFKVEDKKFTITPIYPLHFNEEGGKGIEWGTFNPLHTSLYSADYRFKEDGEVYAVTRGALEYGKKNDYPTQKDDTKDILDEDKKATWGEIVKVASDYRDEKIGDKHITTDEDGGLNIVLSGLDNTMTLSSEKHIKLIATQNVSIKAEKVKFDESSVGTVESLSGLSLGATPEVIMLSTKISTEGALLSTTPAIKLGMQNNFSNAVYYDATENKVHIPYELKTYYTSDGSVYDPYKMTGATKGYIDSAATTSISNGIYFIKGTDDNVWHIKAEDGEFKKVKKDNENHVILTAATGYENIVLEDIAYTSDTFTKLEAGQTITTKTINLAYVATLESEIEAIKARLDKLESPTTE